MRVTAASFRLYQVSNMGRDSVTLRSRPSPTASYDSNVKCECSKHEYPQIEFYVVTEREGGRQGHQKYIKQMSLLLQQDTKLDSEGHYITRDSQNDA